MKFKFKFLEKFFKKKFVCPGAFTQVYIYPDGKVFLCPDCLMTKNAEIGNLNDNTFEEIYNSKKAIKIRKEILKGKYNYCSPALCYSKSNFNIRLTPYKDVEYKAVLKKPPRMVCIGPDAECNAKCVMCRTDISRLSDEEIKAYNDKIENLYIPILKGVEELTLSTTSDPFASRNTRLLMQTAAKTYPNLKFNLITNGTLCDEHNCLDTQILDRMSNVMVSIHGSDEETYNRIVRTGNYAKVMENIQWLKSLKEQKRIKGLYLAFVISTQNYQNIPDFIKFAEENKIEALFWCCIDWGGNLDNDGESLNICEPTHSKFKDFVEVIKNTNLESKYAHFAQIVKKIKDYYTNKKEE